MSIFDEDPFPKTFPMAKAPDSPKAAAAAAQKSESPQNDVAAGEEGGFPRTKTKAAFCKDCPNPPGSPPVEPMGMA